MTPSRLAKMPLHAGTGSACVGGLTALYEISLTHALITYSQRTRDVPCGARQYAAITKPRTRKLRDRMDTRTLPLSIASWRPPRHDGIFAQPTLPSPATIYYSLLSE
jgi:hypothetical protein